MIRFAHLQMVAATDPDYEKRLLEKIQ